MLNDIQWKSCLLCRESFCDVSRHKQFLQLCEGCGINHNNKVSRQNKRAKREGYEGKLYLINWVYVMHIHGYSCVHCKTHGSLTRLTLDHIIPLCRGGKNKPDNIQPLCNTCHIIKDQYV